MPATPRYSFPYPAELTPDDVPLWMNNLATSLDNHVLGFSQGLLSARGSATPDGRLYWSTDAGVLDMADQAHGTWRRIGAYPTPPIARYWADEADVTSNLAPPLNDARVDRLLAFQHCDFALNGFTNAGVLNPAVPASGTYQISGQVTFAHLNPFYGAGFGVPRTQNENYFVSIVRADGPNHDAPLCQVMIDDEYLGTFDTTTRVNCPAVQFECLVPFDLSVGESSIHVYVRSSPPPTTQSFEFMQIVLGGDPATTYVELELVNAI